jgi:hypothetical protein
MRGNLLNNVYRIRERSTIAEDVGAYGVRLVMMYFGRKTDGLKRIIVSQHAVVIIIIIIIIIINIIARWLHAYNAVGLTIKINAPDN